MNTTNPKIIGLWGKGSRGKTHTLNLVVVLLKIVAQLLLRVRYLPILARTVYT